MERVTRKIHVAKDAILSVTLVFGSSDGVLNGVFQQIENAEPSGATIFGQGFAIPVNFEDVVELCKALEINYAD